MSARAHSSGSSLGQAWARMTPLLGDRRGSVAALALFSVLSGFVEAGILVIVEQAAIALVDGTSRLRVDAGPLHAHATVGVLLAAAFALAGARFALQVPICSLPSRIAADVQAWMRRELFDAFTHASWDAQSRDREGHLQEMLTSQVVMATQGALQATTLVTALVTFLVLVASALALNVAAAAVVLAAASLVFGVLRPLNTLGTRRARSLSQAQMDYASGVGEAIRLAEETDVFGVAEEQRRRIGALAARAQSLFFRTQLLSRLVPSIYQGLIYLIIVAGLAGLYAADAGHVGSLGAVVLLLVRAGGYGQQVQGSYQFVRQSMPFIERIQTAQHDYAQSAKPDGREPLTSVRTLAFENVSYAYRPGRPVLEDVTFEAAAGEAIGIIGPSGAGKSTLVQILLQLRAPDRGRYLLNGVPADRFARADWQRRAAYVPQEPRLIHASVADNIRYFRALDEQAVERAARLARVHEDIVAWPHGYDTVVGPRADAVSGGQQQRICLARALAGEPDVLVLDEPTSALDPRSETLIQDSLQALKGKVSLFIVAHRMSTLQICDRVIVIVDGRLEAFDSTALLSKESAYYRSAAKLAVGSGVSDR